MVWKKESKNQFNLTAKRGRSSCRSGGSSRCLFNPVDAAGSEGPE